MKAVSDKRRLENAGHAAIRLQVFERDDSTCRAAFLGYSLCFGPLTPHHILKASQGGKYAFDNLASLCQHHNDLAEADADFSDLLKLHGLVKSPDRTIAPHARSLRGGELSQDGQPMSATPPVSSLSAGNAESLAAPGEL